MMDLVQEGNIGLMQAVKRYDPYRGVKLSSYAAWWIRAYRLRFILNNWRLVKVGTTQAQRKLFFNLNKEKARLTAMGIEPSHAEIAKRLNVAESEVTEMDRRLARADASLDATVNEADGRSTTRLELMPSSNATPDQIAEGTEFSELLHAQLDEFRKTLSGKDIQIFDKRVVADEPLTLQELGDEFGVSRERVRQLEARLMGKLREHLRENFGDAGRRRRRLSRARSVAGKLYLVGTPIGNLGDITVRALDTLRLTKHVAAEDTRRTRQLLTHFAIAERHLHALDANASPRKNRRAAAAAGERGRSVVGHRRGHAVGQRSGNGVGAGRARAGHRRVSHPRTERSDRRGRRVGLGGRELHFFGFLAALGAKAKRRAHALGEEPRSGGAVRVTPAHRGDLARAGSAPTDALLHPVSRDHQAARGDSRHRRSPSSASARANGAVRSRS